MRAKIGVASLALKINNASFSIFFLTRQLLKRQLFGQVPSFCHTFQYLKQNIHLEVGERP